MAVAPGASVQVISGALLGHRPRGFTKLALEPRYIMPSIELPAHGSKCADVFEAYAAMQRHACFVWLRNTSIGIAISQTRQLGEQPL